MIHINVQDTDDTERNPLNLEWLDTNDRGGYASSTLSHCNTRKYHGLLVANLLSPPGRYVLLSKFEDSICCRNEEFFLSQHQYPGVLFPPHPHLLKEYILDIYPKFIYRMKDLEIRKSIMMVSGEDTVLIRYDIAQFAGAGLLRIKPFLAYRGYHRLSQENPYLKTAAAAGEKGFKIEPYDGMPPLVIETNVESQFSADPCWYKRFEYRIEQERGFDAHEDLFCPGILDIPFERGSTVFVAASLRPIEKPLDEKWTTEQKRRTCEAPENRQSLASIAADEDRHHLENLMAAGRQFLIHTPSGRPAVIAGYHWFSDWGRDTLIALPGLTFCSHCHEEGIAILTMLAKHEKEGLLPNYFSENETEIAYNTVDASLWYFWAVQQMLLYTGAIDLIAEQIWPVMKNIIRHFIAGTALNVYMNAQTGLLHAGDESMQLTWMDAMVDGKPVTPRWGYAVEINALWYNALCFTQALGTRFGDHDLPLAELTGQIPPSFSDVFWVNNAGYLADCVNHGRQDTAIRPNQILAVSLPYSPISNNQAAGVVDTVKRHLLTPVGLRTLSSKDGRYRGTYGGSSVERDTAYHQGTVWPWLFGHFGEACLKISRDKTATVLFLLDILRPFLQNHLQAAGCGSISEIFAGNPPHRPDGCIAQAWSVAEIIRLYTLLVRP
jgi:predicted glycogen debranching enzyme